MLNLLIVPFLCDCLCDSVSFAYDRDLHAIRQHLLSLLAPMKGSRVIFLQQMIGTA